MNLTIRDEYIIKLKKAISIQIDLAKLKYISKVVICALSFYYLERIIK